MGTKDRLPVTMMRWRPSHPMCGLSHGKVHSEAWTADLLRYPYSVQPATRASPALDVSPASPQYSAVQRSVRDGAPHQNANILSVWFGISVPSF
jgi:hypothetical protein